MEKRHGGEHFVTDAEHGVRGDDLLPEGVEVPVGQDDALRGAGGAAGIEDDRRVIRFAGDPVIVKAVAGETHELLPADDGGVLGDFPDLPALGQHITGPDRARESILDRGDDDVDHAGVGADVFEFVIELIQCDGGDRLGLVQVKLDLLLGGEGVNHVGHGADHVDGIEHEDGLRAVRHGNGDPVVFPDTDGFQRFGTAFDLAQHLAIGRRPAHEIKGDIVRVLFGNLSDFVNHRAFKILQMHGDVPHLGFPGGFRSDSVHKVCLLLTTLLYKDYSYS